MTRFRSLRSKGTHTLRSKPAVAPTFGVLLVLLCVSAREVRSAAPDQPAMQHQAHDGEYGDWCALHVARREYSEAIADCDHALEGGLANADIYSARSAAYFMLGELGQALADVDLAIRLKPTDAHLHYNRGVIFSKQGEHTRAVESYSEAIRLNPKHALAYHNRAVAYERLGESDKATADYERAWQLAPALRNILKRSPGPGEKAARLAPLQSWRLPT